jgi:hypothetical protein
MNVCQHLDQCPGKEILNSLGMGSESYKYPRPVRPLREGLKIISVGRFFVLNWLTRLTLSIYFLVYQMAHCGLPTRCSIVKPSIIFAFTGSGLEIMRNSGRSLLASALALFVTRSNAQTLNSVLSGESALSTYYSLIQVLFQL